MARRATRRTRTAAPDQLSLGRGLGAGQLARNPRPLHRRAEGQEEADRGDHLPALSPARRHAQAPGRRARTKAPGGKYLIQHSAGSGKTNSIAWSAHFLADLHDAQQREAVLTVIVVSDRNVIDAQLQDALFDFERTRASSPRSRARAPARAASWPRRWPAARRSSSARSRRFPFALEGRARAGGDAGQAVRGDRRRGAQLADRRGGREAQAVLSAEEMAELDDGGEVSTEDMLAAQMAARAERQAASPMSPSPRPQGEDAGALRPPPEPDRARRRRQPAGAVPRLFDAAGDRGGLHPRRAEELHALQAGLPARARRQGVGRQGGRAQTPR